jgi:4-amino-4-deoxy-L-arabinose transferase-like glycosyltransferase
VQEDPSRPELPRKAVAGILALPFLIGIAALRGLTAMLPIFHSDDEFNYHLPTILRFSHELPFPDLIHYRAAQTPLFHLLMAYAGKLIGYELWRLRLVETVISYGLALAVYVLLRRRLKLPQLTALALTLLFTLSPYVLGSSFRVITDNLAALLIVIALERFERFRETADLTTYAVGCAAVGAAILTRQSAAFMLGVGFLYLVVARSRLTTRRGSLALVALTLSAVPAGVLFLEWHGLVPPGGDPSSCGLCSGHGGTGLTLETPELALATIGLYGAVLFAPQLIGNLKGGVELGGLRGPLIGAVLGALLLLAFPTRPGADAAGVIASTARHFPSVFGSSLVYWALVPLAGAILAWRIEQAPRMTPIVLFLSCFLLGALAIRYPWQKYVDPFALLALIATTRPSEFTTRRALAGAALLAVAFVAYTADYSAHSDVKTATLGGLSTPGVLRPPRVRPRAIYETAANPSATFGQLTTFQNASM